MPSPKEVLLKHGRIKAISRGRISSDNHKWLAEYVANGGKVDGYEAVESHTSTGEKPVFKNAVAPTTNEKIVAEYTLVRPLDAKAYAFWGGKKVNVGMAEICRHCSVSLVQCTCGAPEVVNHSGTGTMRAYFEDEK